MKKVVIIGGGVAGLSAGIYSALSGYETEIYEKNPVVGGECMGWNRNGCHIDNCIHWLTGTKKGTGLREVWEKVGALEENTEFAPTKAFYTSIAGNQRATLWNDLDRTEREWLALSPEDADEIRKFILHVRYAQSCEVPAAKPMDMMGIKDYIGMGKSMAEMPKVMKEYGKISLEDLASRFKSPVLRKLFCDYLPKEYTASSFVVSYATITCGNGAIPSGGSLAMANRMAGRFKELGGKLYCNSGVRKILVEKKKACGIELENGEKVTADYVISATDTKVLFDRFIGNQYMNKKWREVYSDEKRFPLISGFQTAFAIDTDKYHEKDTIVFDCEPFVIGENSVSRMSVKSFEYEPGFAPEGKTVLQANIAQYDADYRYWMSLSDADYKRVKTELAQTVMERITTQFPELSGSITLLDCWTPRTYTRYCAAYHGGYMSFITKKGEKSFHVKGTVKGIGNLYIASQWIMAPGGLPVAVTAGKFAVQRILKKEKRPYENI